MAILSKHHEPEHHSKAAEEKADAQRVKTHQEQVQDKRHEPKTPEEQAEAQRRAAREKEHHAQPQPKTPEQAEAQRIKTHHEQAEAQREKELASRKINEEAQKKHANVVAGNLKVG